MTTVRMVTPDFVANFEYTNRFIPNKELDSRAKRVAKWVAIIFTLGLIFIIPLTMDFSKKLFNKLFGRAKLPRIDPISNSPATPPISSPPAAVSAPVNSTSQNIWNFVKAVFNKENVSKTFASAYDGIKVLPKSSISFLSNPNNDRYQNIGYALGITTPLWVVGGFIKGSAVSLAFNGGGLAIAKIHEKLMTPPENR
ncbi:MAG: hypothetical protein KR126chlam4_01424 [Candidatus Anoxychlamydiales bacterium]|nr:hypothetical protein [Candidatus Anoxychlamydiales bacterium]NGX41582.1 hypothetical protein [Candidatus Anoxychlamydiales bacterium]